MKKRLLNLHFRSRMFKIDFSFWSVSGKGSHGYIRTWQMTNLGNAVQEGEEVG